MDDYIFVLEIENDENPISKNRIRLSEIIKFCYVIAVNLPFIIGDIYFGYNNISCQDDHNTGIGLSLRPWLKISGFSHIIIILLLLLLKRTKLFNLLSIMPDFIWSVLGFVMFVGFLEPSGTCGDSVYNYMWIRITVGTIIRTSTIYFI